MRLECSPGETVARRSRMVEDTTILPGNASQATILPGRRQPGNNASLVRRSYRHLVDRYALGANPVNLRNRVAK